MLPKVRSHSVTEVGMRIAGGPWSGQHVSMWLLPSNPLYFPNNPQGQTAGCFLLPSYNQCLQPVCSGVLSKDLRAP